MNRILSPSGEVIPASEGTLIYFASYLSRTVKHSTIKLYLRAVRNLHISSGYNDPLQGKPEVSFVSIWSVFTFFFSFITMVKRCVIQFCGNSSKTGHRVLPKDPSLRRQWVKFVQVKRVNFSDPSENSVICGSHFWSESFERCLMNEMGLKKQRLLVPGAVPTIQPEPPVNSDARKRAMDSEQQTASSSKKKPRTSKAVHKLEVNRVSGL